MSPHALLERLLRDGTAIARSDGTLHSLFPVAVNAAEGEALRERVVQESAARTIEIGLGYGIAALHICDGLLANGHAGARHVAVDPHQSTRFAGCGLQFLEEAAFVDDHQLPSVARAASFCLTNLGWTLEEASADDELHHWAVLRTSHAPDPRPFDPYVDF